MISQRPCRQQPTTVSPLRLVGHTALVLALSPVPALACGPGEHWGMRMPRIQPERGMTSNHTAGLDTLPTVRFAQSSLFDRRTGSAWASQGSLEERDGWQTFDNVRFSSSEYLTSVRWEGFFYSAAGEGDYQNVSHWKIQIWDDQDGRPGEVLRSEVHFPHSGYEMWDDWEDERLEGEDGQGTTVVSGTRGWRMIQADRQVTVRDYAVELESPFLANSGETYWISVAAVAPTADPAFVWTAGKGCECELPPLSFAPLPPSDGSYQRDLHTGELTWREGDRALTLVGAPAEDSDRDGMADRWEEAHGLDPRTHDAFGDLDQDGATNLVEFARRSDPADEDTDRDGRRDGEEIQNWVSSNPTVADTDGDGLLDGEEVVEGVWVSDPNNADSDGDGYSDGFERLRGYDPVNASDRPEARTLQPEATPALPSYASVSVFAGNSPAPTKAPYGIDSGEDDGTFVHVGPNPSTLPAQDAASGHLAFDQDPATAWNCATDCSFPLWVDTTFPEPMPLTSFTMTLSEEEGTAPAVWEVQGTNDGIHFTTIFQQRDFRSAAGETLRYEAGVHFEQAPAFSTIRFVVYETGWNGLALPELDFVSRPNPISNFAVLPASPSKNGPRGIRVQWSAEPGATCVVERSPDMQSWTVISSPVPGTGLSQRTVYLDQTSASRTMFYRVRELE